MARACHCRPSEFFPGLRELEAFSVDCAAARIGGPEELEAADRVKDMPRSARLAGL